MTIYSRDNLNLAIALLFMSNLSVAIADVIVDSLMVIQSRKYPEEGSEELNSFSWISLSFGGFCGSIAAAFLTESYEPKYCFLYSCIMGFVIAFVAYRLNIQIEREGESDLDGNRTLCQDIRRSAGEIKEACTMKEYYRVILYLTIGALCVPSFSQFGYYFMLDEVHLSKFTYSMLTVLAYICLMIGSVAYNRCFRETEYRKLIIIDALITIFFCPF